MLSDRERETLYDMEHHLLIEDPRLATRFKRAACAPPTLSHKVLTLALGLALLMGAFAILFGAPGTAVAFVMVAGGVALARSWDQLPGVVRRMGNAEGS